MRLDQAPVFSLHARHGNHLQLASATGAVAHVWVLEDDIVRVLVLPQGVLDMPRTWTVAPGLAALPVEGRDRFDLSGFSLPPYTLTQDGDGAAARLCVQTGAVRLTIALDGLRCQWESLHRGTWVRTAADRPTQSYNFGWWDEKVYHYLQRTPGEAYFGLGERAGDANRAGQRYRMCNLDPMGYSARSTDPLYKHIPFYITRHAGTGDGAAAGACFGLFYDTLSDCSFDMGREMDNYHGHYRYFVADHGDLDLYYIAGPDPAAITRRYTWLTGRPIFPPRFALGYSGSTMLYTDAENAQERMGEFLARCAEHDIPCDSFHLSSGYTSIGRGRYVFHWNRDKFPDPAGFVRSYLEHGVRLVPNLKPALLRDHPRFEEARAAGLLVHDPDGQPTAVQFWDGTGAYLDFTHPRAFAWWQQQVTEQLLQLGIPSTWNDNNEFEVWSAQAQIHGFGTPRAAREARPLQTLLMLQASHGAQTAFAPEERPYLVSRSGAAGMQRYVQTWSGDNYTSWETLRYNIRMGLGLAMSGVSNTGHDIGGFSGPAPSPELLLRWVQFGIFLPRFSIHSWNDDATVNEPWMYPEVTPQVRALIHLRYRLLPCLYDLVWRYHQRFEPIIRPTFHDFPDDERCYEENDDMLLGPNLLVAAVVAPGQLERTVWLPGSGDAGWYEWHSARHWAGGQQVMLQTPLDGPPPLLAREGCAVALNVADIHFGAVEDRRGFQIFPLRGTGTFETTCFEDDGHSQACRDGLHGQWRLQVSSTAETLHIAITREGRRPPTQDTLLLRLPAADQRTLQLAGGTLQHEVVVDGGVWRELTVALGPLPTGQPAELLVDAQARLGEGPLWCPVEQALYWTDIQSSTLSRWRAADGAVRVWPMPERLGSFAFCETPGRLLLALESGVALFDLARGALLTPIVPVEPENPTTRLNDGRCDPQGRFVVGIYNQTPDEAPIGHFYRVTGVDGTLQVERLPLPQIGVANSLAFSPDGAWMYFTDSPTRQIWRVAYHADGTLGTPEPFVRLADHEGYPDGATVDAEGGLWSAQWRGNCVVRYDTKGRETDRLPLPASQITCPVFGGAAMDTLFVTSARAGVTPQELVDEPAAGGVFRLWPGRRGLAPHRFRECASVG